MSCFGPTYIKLLGPAQAKPDFSFFTKKKKRSLKSCPHHVKVSWFLEQIYLANALISTDERATFFCQFRINFCFAICLLNWYRQLNVCIFSLVYKRIVGGGGNELLQHFTQWIACFFWNIWIAIPWKVWFWNVVSA